MTRDEHDEVVREYLSYLRHVRLPEELPRSREEATIMLQEMDQRSSENPHGDAWEAVDDLIQSDPEGAWAVLRESIVKCHDRDLGMIGAGCLETFMWYRGVEFLDRVLAEIRSDSRFLEAFRAVYLGRDFPEAEGRIINSVLVSTGAAPESIMDWWTPEPDA